MAGRAGTGALLGVPLGWGLLTTGVQEPAPGAGGAGGAAPAGRLSVRARLALALVFCVVCVEWSVGFWGATFADDQVGLSTGAAVTLSSAFFAAMLAGRVAGSVLARRVRTERLVATGLAIALLGFPALWTAGGAVQAGAGLVLVGFGIGSLFPLALALTFAAAPGRTTLASSHAVMAGSAAVLVAPLVLGQIADAGGLRLALGVVPVFLILGLTTLAVLARGPAPRPATT